MKLPRRFQAIATLLFLVAAAPTRADGPAAAGDVDLQGSRVYVLVRKRGLGHDHAVMGPLRAGHVRLGAAEAAGSLVFDMTGFRADTPEARKLLSLEGETDEDTRRQVDANMLGPAVLHVEKHPTATFEIRSSLPSSRPAAADKKAFDLVGTFTLHGVSRPLSVRVEVEAAGPVDRLWGGFAVKQTDHGMKPFSKLGGVVGVADELTIYGDIRVIAGNGR